MDGNKKKSYTGNVSLEPPASLDVEKHFLSGIIRYPQYLADVAPFVTESCFTIDLHRVIFSSIKSLYSSDKGFDRFIISQHVRNIGINEKDGVNVAEYIDAIYHLDAVSEDSILDYFAELQKFRIARELVQSSVNIIHEVKRNISKDADEIISLAEKTFANTIDVYDSNNEPSDLFDGMKEYVEELSDNLELQGIVPPYSIFRKVLGNFLPGNVYCFISPPKNGKSTLLNHISFGVSCLDWLEGKQNVKTLILDTELEKEIVQTRTVSAMAGVNESLLRNGDWKKDPEMTRKVRTIWQLTDKLSGQNRITHEHVAGKPIEEVMSIIKRWAYKHIDESKGERGMVIYDYLKMTGEKLSDHFKEYQVMGQKIDLLKQVGSKYKLPIITAVQTNANGDIAMSKQIRWFASLTAFFRRKTLDEIGEHGPAFGTHIMEVDECRFQGPEGDRFFTPIRSSDGLCNDSINFEIKNFSVEEKGTYRDVLRRQSGQLGVSKKKGGTKHDFEEDDDYVPL